jgi:hypothetical protein
MARKVRHGGQSATHTATGIGRPVPVRSGCGVRRRGRAAAFRAFPNHGAWLGRQ